MKLIDNNTQISLKEQCKLLELNRSSYYYKPCPESQENLKILLWLDEKYFQTPYYGKRRLLNELKAVGYCINIKRLNRLMEIQGWRTLYPAPCTSIMDKKSYKYPYLLKGLEINKKNHVWEIDITYLPMERGYLFLCAIIDVYSRYIVGWDISNSMTSKWCTEIVIEAINKYGKPSILNSDQGSQFTSEEYIQILQKNKIQISMDGKGRALDNIYIERLWRTIKYEHFYLNVYLDATDVYAGLNNYIKFYNDERRHQSLNYETPAYRYGGAS